MARPRYRLSKKKKKKERRAAARQHKTVEQHRIARGLAPDGTNQGASS